jgi:hypothetical protein
VLRDGAPHQKKQGSPLDTRLRSAAFSTMTLICLALTAGCATQTTVTGWPMDTVINGLKARLKTVGPIEVTYTAEKGCTPSGNYKIVAFPTKTQVQLKTVLTDTNTVGIGAQFGTPVVVTPSAQRAASSVKTTQTTVNFCAIPESLSATDGNAPNGDCLWTLKNTKGDYVRLLWPTKVAQVTLQKPEDLHHDTPVTVKAANQPQPNDLADALKATLGGLVYSQHMNACLLPETMDVQLAFEASTDTQTGLKLALVFVNFQDTQEAKRDYTNTIDVTFNLSKGSTATLLNAMF